MFKRLLILIMIFSGIFASPVNQENAEGVAMNLVMERSDDFEFEIRNVEQVVDDNVLVYYIFHLNPIGFLLLLLMIELYQFLVIVLIIYTGLIINPIMLVTLCKILNHQFVIL